MTEAMPTKGEWRVYNAGHGYFFVMTEDGDTLAQCSETDRVPYDEALANVTLFAGAKKTKAELDALRAELERAAERTAPMIRPEHEALVEEVAKVQVRG